MRMLPLTARRAGAEVRASSASNDEAVTCSSNRKNHENDYLIASFTSIDLLLFFVKKMFLTGRFVSIQFLVFSPFFKFKFQSPISDKFRNLLYLGNLKGEP